ncbi:cytochrome P450 724B1-like [Nymphaea colorata]|nr:cytochrome P450 724B1-like [Nymphaea colorata]
MAELILSFFLSVLFIVVLSLCLRHFFPLTTTKRPAPPGSFGWPLLGETFSLLRPHASNELGQFLSGHCSRYGKVFKSHLFGSPTVVSCDHELNTFILQNEEKLFECSYPNSIHGVLGESSMLVVVGEKHKRLRSLALALVFAAKSKPEFLIDIERTAILVMESWKDKDEVVFSAEAKKFTFDVIVKQILSLTPDDPRTTRILESFLTFMKGLVSFPLYIPGTPYARAVQARCEIHTIVKAVLEERSNAGEPSRNMGDFLDVLISNTTLSVDEKVSLVVDLLLGGHETTSLLISMMVYFLGHSPSVLKQLREEHIKIRRRKQKREFLNWEDYNAMECTQQVINEALRCGNVVKFLHRRAIKDVKFKDYFIPAGWKVLPVFSAVHLDPSLHLNAHQFHPWRWKGHTSSKKFTPFGGGPRFCPGSDLAKVETAFFLHHFLLNFSWTAHDAEEPTAYPYVEFRRGLTIHLQRLPASS